MTTMTKNIVILAFKGEKKKRSLINIVTMAIESKHKEEEWI